MARARKAAQKKGRTLRLDFTGVGEGYFTPPEGEYNVEIVKVEEGESSGGNPQLQLDYKILDGKFAGKTIRGWYSLAEQALWKLARELRSAGVELPEEPVDLDFDDIEGRKLTVMIEHREYNGDTKADIMDSWGIEQDGADEDDEEEEAPKSSKKSKKPADDEEDEKPARRSRKKKEPEPEDDEDEEEEEAPKGKASRSSRGSDKSKKKLAKLSSDEVGDMDEDELEEVVTKYSLDVDLSSAKTLRKKAALVTDALEEAGHLED